MDGQRHLARVGARTLAGPGLVYNLTMDPFEKYDMLFNGAVPARHAPAVAGQIRRSGQRLGRRRCSLPVVMDFNKSIVDFPSKKRVAGGASNDWRPNLQRPDNPVPLLDMKKPPQVKSMGVD